MDFSAETQLSRQQRALEILASLSWRTGDINQYLHSVAIGVSELIGLDWSVITLRCNEATRVLASTIDLGEAANQLYHLHGTLAGTVIINGCPLVVEDANTCKEYGETPPGYQAYLGIPLRITTGEIIGTICSFQKYPRSFTPDEVQLVTIFAERAATAIDNYQLYQQQIHLNHLLETKIQKLEFTEKALRESEVRFRTLVEQAADAFLLVNPQGQLVDVNQYTCESLGYTREELLGMSIADIETKYSLNEIVQIRQQFALTQTNTVEGMHRRKDGSLFPVEVRVRLFEVGGETLELALVRDISDRKRAEKALQCLAEIGELASTIVHEVRNPLTTILMGLNFFKRIDLPDVAQIRLELALDEAERLKRLLNEILLYAKQPLLNLVEIEVNSYITTILKQLNELPTASGRPIRFMPFPHSSYIYADPDKLKQVFLNLGENALESTPQGEEITWQVSLLAKGNSLIIRIYNPGSPIPSDILPKLTKPFFTTKGHGNGLGLAIVKKIVEAHGGEFQIDSSEEIGGTIATVVLPVYQGSTTSLQEVKT